MGYESWQVRMDMPIIGFDRFRRTETATWGDEETGITYVNSGTASDYFADGTRAAHLLSVVNDLHVSRLDLPVNDAYDILATVAVNAVATGSSITARIGLGSDNSNYVELQLNFTTAGTTTVQVGKRVGGTGAVLLSAVQIGTYTAGAKWSMRLRRDTAGGWYVRIWPVTQTEPANWQLYVVDTALGVFTAALFMSRAETGNTNTSPTVYWYAQQVTTARRMVDITGYVDSMRSPMSATLGSTAETDGEPSNAMITLNNSDQRFTPGNNQSPYWPNIKSARLVDVVDILGYQLFHLFTGRVTFPEIDSWTESTATAPRDQAITLSLADLRADLDRVPAFVSTLAAHIQANDPGSLVDYWPMNGATQPLVNLVEPSAGMTVRNSIINGTPLYVLPVLQGQVVAPGDDVSTAQTGYLTGWFGVDRPSVPIGPADIVTFAFWCRLNFGLVNNFLAIADTGFNFAIDSAAGPLTFTVLGFNGMTGTLTTTQPPFDVPTFIVARMRRNPALLEMWVNGTVFTGSLTGVDSGALCVYAGIDQFGFAASAGGGGLDDLGLAHLQVYIGPEAVNLSYAAAEAQRQVGLYGLEGQTTGQRVASIATYAGVPATDLAAIDPGVSVMQPVRLAGGGVNAAIGEAVDTEQGHIGVRADGLLEFADRRRIYNI